MRTYSRMFAPGQRSAFMTGLNKQLHPLSFILNELLRLKLARVWIVAMTKLYTHPSLALSETTTKVTRVPTNALKPLQKPWKRATPTRKPNFNTRKSRYAHRSSHAQPKLPKPYPNTLKPEPSTGRPKVKPTKSCKPCNIPPVPWDGLLGPTKEP